MDEKVAKKIGIKYGIKSIIIGLIIFYFIPLIFLLLSGEGLKSIIWLNELDLYSLLFILNWVFLFFLFAFIFGMKAGKEILTKKRDYEKVGMKYGFLTLLFASFFGCLPGLITEGMNGFTLKSYGINAYIFKPMFWILLFGIIPSILTGRWLGKKIKSKILANSKDQSL
jgi:hypothetical protein